LKSSDSPRLQKKAAPGRGAIAPADPVRRRRALSHVGGAVEVGDAAPELAGALRGALSVALGDEDVQPHVHGFHSYPARMHPDTARTLIGELSRPRDVVFDPFCGSGTVVVAARELGRRALGSDLNPLAVELTWLKTRGSDPAFSAALNRAAETVVEHARARQKAELGPSVPYGPEDRASFPTYVLLALDGLRHGIDQIRDREVRRALNLVLSSLLTKLSQKAGDSSNVEQSKRLSRTFAFRFFGLKTAELAERLAAFSALVPEGTPPARLVVADARRLGALEPSSVDLVVSSPPYPGVYDYFAHHELRLRWLRLDARELMRGELAPRRQLGRADTRGGFDFEKDFERCFSELRRVLKPRGRIALLVADSVVAGRAVYADVWLKSAAERAGLQLAATASQSRPHFHGPTADAFRRRPRREHLFVLTRR
jgi:SAM-dependent methyltransferase